MLRRFAPAAVLLTLATAPLPAQLGLITVPQHSLRIDIAGAFYPNDQVWVNGTRQSLGSFVNGTTNPAITGLQASLASVTGQPVTGLSLGGITAIASRDHGVGDLGFAYGLTHRITIFGYAPIVYVRSHITTTFDPTTSRVGLNPANLDPAVGTSTGPGNAVKFFGDLQQALDTLRARVQHGDYAGDAAKQALAQQTVTSGTTFYNALYALIADPARASAVLPVGTDPSSTQLLARITALEGTLTGPLGVPANFTTLPEFPASTLTSNQFDALLNSPSGLALSSPNSLPHYGLGDMSAGIAFLVAQRGSPGVGAWRSVWLRATMRFPNGTSPNPSILLDQGTGAKHKALQLDGIVEFGAGPVGLRAEATYLHHLPASSLTRPTSLDQLLVPPTYLAAVTTQSGDSIAITARPFFAFAPHLAVTGVLQYWRRASSSTGYLTGQLPIPGVDPSTLDVGSAANAMVAGIGLSYYHDGHSRDGTVSLPVEAAWSIERTLTSSLGIFPVSLTSRVSLRIYRPLFTH
jgi:hypothetical protein